MNYSLGYVLSQKIDSYVEDLVSQGAAKALEFGEKVFFLSSDVFA